MIRADVILREMRFSPSLHEVVDKYARENGCTYEEATASSVVQEAYKRHTGF